MGITLIVNIFPSEVWPSAPTALSLTLSGARSRISIPEEAVQRDYAEKRGLKPKTNQKKIISAAKPK